MTHCTNYIRMDNKSSITEVIVPPSQVSRVELYVMRLMFRLGDQPLSAEMRPNGLFISVIFHDDAKRQEFCRLVEEAIDAEPTSTSATGEH